MIKDIKKVHRSRGYRAICICDWCGKETSKCYSLAMQSKNHFCGKDCYFKWYKKNMSGKNGARYGTKREQRKINEIEKYKKEKRDFRNCKTAKHSLGYTLSYIPEHPCSNKTGYVPTHRLIMEDAIGRYLKPNEIVHHIDGNVTNNHLENLIYFQDNGEHLRWHKKMKKQKTKPKNQVVIAEGEIDNIKWESPYNKLVFYFKGLPYMIGIKTIKGKRVKIILESEE